MKIKCVVLAFTVIIANIFIQVAFASRPGIDCDCSTTGEWIKPDTGREPDVKPGGTSPSGIYNLTATPTLTGEITLTVRRASDNEIVYSQEIGSDSGWGFSPDDHHFVVHTLSWGPIILHAYTTWIPIQATI